MRLHLPAAMLLLTALLFTGCAKEEGEDTPAQIDATQDMLDAASILRAQHKTGTHFEPNDHGGRDSIPLDPRKWDGTIATSVDPDASLRTVTATFSKTQNIPVGAVIAKKVYAKNVNGGPGKIQNIAVMVKQPEGYFPEGGNWEYMLIDPSTVSDQHPNGQLSGATYRGNKQDCADCHSRAGADFVFLN